jgi:hypothetical protein
MCTCWNKNSENVHLLKRCFLKFYSNKHCSLKFYSIKHCSLKFYSNKCCSLKFYSINPCWNKNSENLHLLE